MGRKSVAAVSAIFIAPLVVGVMVNLGSPWLLANAGAIGSVLTSPWLPWILYAVMGVPWFYYWFVVVPRRIAPQARLQRINDLFAEREALDWIARPLTQPDPPRGYMRRVERFRDGVGKVIGSDPIFRQWLSSCSQYEAILRDQPQADGRPLWRAAALALLFQADDTLAALQGRLSPTAPQFPRTSRHDR